MRWEDARHRICAECGKAYAVSKLCKRKHYVCPVCTKKHLRRGGKNIARRK
nr:MAG TPA: DNA-directed RNA polymerase [Caudoviricetes sp.]